MGRDGVDVHIGRRVHKVNGIGDAIAHGELHAVHVIAQDAVEQPRVLRNPLAQRRGQVVMLHQVTPLLGVILNGHDVVLADANAAHIGIPLDVLLQHHAQRARLVIGADQLVNRIHAIAILPAAAPGVLEDGGQPHILGDGVPVQRIHEVAQALADHPLRVGLHGQHKGLGRGHAQPRRQTSPKELVVRAPPEGVVDHIGPLEHGILEISAVIGDFVADAVNEHGIGARLVHLGAAQLHILRHHTRAAAVHLVQKRRRKAPLAPDDHPNLLDFTHVRCSLSAHWLPSWTASPHSFPRQSRFPGAAGSPGWVAGLPPPADVVAHSRWPRSPARRGSVCAWANTCGCRAAAPHRTAAPHKGEHPCGQASPASWRSSSQLTPTPKPGSRFSGLRNSSSRSNSCTSNNSASSPRPKLSVARTR